MNLDVKPNYVLDAEDGAGSQPDEPYDSSIKTTVEIQNMSPQDIGAWFYQVQVSSFHMDNLVGRATAFLAMRERIQAGPRDSQPLIPLEAMRRTCPGLYTLFLSSGDTLQTGFLHSEFPRFPNGLFVYDDFRLYRESHGNNERGKDPRLHPAQRAWVLSYRDIFVDPQYRRRGIATMMVRTSLVPVARLAEKNHRPLVAAAQPGLLPNTSCADLADYEGTGEKRQRARIAKAFWAGIGFRAHNPSVGGSGQAWYFWGKLQNLPRKRDIVIPEDLLQKQPKPTSSRREWPPAIPAGRHFVVEPSTYRFREASSSPASPRPRPLDCPRPITEWARLAWQALQEKKFIIRTPIQNIGHTRRRQRESRPLVELVLEREAAKRLPRMPVDTRIFLMGASPRPPRPPRPSRWPRPPLSARSPLSPRPACPSRSDQSSRPRKCPTPTSDDMKTIMELSQAYPGLLPVEDGAPAMPPMPPKSVPGTPVPVCEPDATSAISGEQAQSDSSRET